MVFSLPSASKKGLDPLPGAIVDLYRMTMYMLEIGIKPLILTDIEPSQINYRVLTRFVGYGEVPLDILDFPHEFLRNSCIRREEDLIRALESLVWDDNKLLFYYSGHGLNNGLLFPDRSHMPLHRLFHLLRSCRRKFFRESSRESGQSLFVLDCCDIPDVNLSFVYRPQEGRFRLNKEPYLQTTDYLLIFRSSTPDGVAGTTRFGSLFTRALTSFLTSRLRSTLLLPHLFSQVPQALTQSYKLTTTTNYMQDLLITSSHNSGPLLWGWLTNSPISPHPHSSHLFLLKTETQESLEEEARSIKVQEQQRKRNQDDNPLFPLNSSLSCSPRSPRSPNGRKM